MCPARSCPPPISDTGPRWPGAGGALFLDADDPLASSPVPWAWPWETQAGRVARGRPRKLVPTPGGRRKSKSAPEAISLGGSPTPQGVQIPPHAVASPTPSCPDNLVGPSQSSRESLWQVSRESPGPRMTNLGAQATSGCRLSSRGRGHVSQCQGAGRVAALSLG